jgi:ABC-type glycerol-3-phosphate transport system permease component
MFSTTRSWRHTTVGHVTLAIVALFCVFPIVWMFFTSFRPASDFFTSGLWPSGFSMSNYSAALSAIPIWMLLWHTIVTSLCVSAGALFLALLAAYSFARFHFRGQNLLFLLFIGSWLVPFQVTMLPNYVLLYHLGLLNSLVGIIVPQLSSAFAVMLLRQHLKAFPTELLEAARLDGLSAWRTLWRVVVPNLGPALAALGILLFVSQWNEYFWPLLVYRTPDSVIQMGIQGFLNSFTVNYGALMAASALATLPIFIIYAVLQRRLVNAFVRSGLR